MTERQRDVVRQWAAMRATWQIEVPMKHGMGGLDKWLDAMNRAWWLEHGGRMEPNDQQPDVESEREKAAYRRGFEAGRAEERAECEALAAAARAQLAQALSVGEGYGTDPTWPVPGASER